jgi:hypothetical protein
MSAAAPAAADASAAALAAGPDTDFAPTLSEPRLTEVLAAAGPAPADEAGRGHAMQQSLRRLLDRVAGSRSALPHLAALESALGQQGLQATDQVSAHSLAKMLAQLRVLPLDPGDGPIQDLLAFLQRVLRRQSREQREHQLSPHDPQSTVIITESSESDFMDALAAARVGR